jgi:hypothetical protein
MSARPCSRAPCRTSILMWISRGSRRMCRGSRRLYDVHTFKHPSPEPKNATTAMTFAEVVDDISRSARPGSIAAT